MFKKGRKEKAKEGKKEDRNFLERLMFSNEYFKITWINAHYMRFQAMEIGFSRGRKKKVYKHVLISSCLPGIV